MPDILMTQVEGTTHHYFALVDAALANLEPSIDLAHYLDAGGVQHDVVNSIQQDFFIEQSIEAEFEAQTTSVKGCIFKPGSYKAIVAPNGAIIERSIQLQITTSAPGDEADAIKMEFEFLHSVGR